MAIEIQVPSVGEAVSEGVLARWLKEDGDFVEADDPVAELETDKASTEVVAPASGVLHVAVNEGDSVAVGAVIGTIEEGEAPAKKDQKKKPEKKEEKEPKQKEDTAQSSESSDETKVSPAARTMIAERGLDPASIRGTGRGGVITKEDVLNLDDQDQDKPKDKQSKEPAAEPKPASGDRTRRERMSPLRSRIAQRLVSSQQSTATLTTFNEADMSAVMALRARYKDIFKERHEVGLGFMSFFVKAAVTALKAFPQVNARIDDNEIVYQNFHDIGVAVSTEKGLMVPVIRDADRLSFAQIEQTIGTLAGKGRSGKLSVDDLQGGTFTITNGGIFGSLLSTPILNPPQCGILGMHSIQKRPVVVDDQIVIRPMMYLALSYDHRLIDGREAVQFLVRIKECVENPERMMLEI